MTIQNDGLMAAKEVDLKNGDSVKVKKDPCGEGWVIAGRQTGNHTGQIYDNGDEITDEIFDKSPPVKPNMPAQMCVRCAKHWDDCTCKQSSR